MVQPFRRALAGQFLMLAQEGGQLQRLEVMGEQDFRRIIHAAPSAPTESSRM